MFCSKCGTAIPDGGAFCPKCGAKIGKVEVSSAAGAAKAPAAESYSAVGIEKASTVGLNPKLIAIVAVVAVVVIALILAVGSCSSNGGSAASSEGASAASTYSGKLGKLIALSNDELGDTLESDGYTKSGNVYTKGDIVVDINYEGGERVIEYNQMTLAYSLLCEEGPGFDRIGAYFTTNYNTEFVVGICDVAGGKGVVVGSGSTSGCRVMVFEPGHFGSMKEIAENVSFSDSMSADEAAKAFARGLEGQGLDHVSGDDMVMGVSSSTTASSGAASSSTTASSGAIPSSTAASSSASSSTGGSVATYDMLTGTVHCNGGNAPDAVNTIVITDDGIIIKGKLMGDAVGGSRSKTWSFGFDENTKFGTVAGNRGFKEEPKDKLIGGWEACNFPQLVLELENGMVKRIYQSA